MLIIPAALACFMMLPIPWRYVMSNQKFGKHFLVHFKQSNLNLFCSSRLHFLSKTHRKHFHDFSQRTHVQNILKLIVHVSEWELSWEKDESRVTREVRESKKRKPRKKKRKKSNLVEFWPLILLDSVSLSEQLKKWWVGNFMKKRVN